MTKDDFLSNGKWVPKRLTESYISQNFPDGLEELHRFAIEHGMAGIPLGRLVWHSMSGITSIPKCRTCGEGSVAWKSFSDGYKSYCSNKCMTNSPDVISRRVANTDYKSPDRKAKTEASNLERHGVKNVMMRGAPGRAKAEATNLERHGNVNPFATDAGKAAIAATNETRYGNRTYIASADGRSKAEAAWGGTSPFSVAETRERAAVSTEERHGSRNYLASEEWKGRRGDLIRSRLQVIVDSRFADLLDRDLNFDDRTLSFTCPTCGARNDSADLSFLQLRVERYGTSPCTACVPKYASAGELALYDMVAAEFPDAVRGHRIGRLEIDVYVPSLQIGFEFNGLFWHREDLRDRWYHLRKSEAMEREGIRLYHVWEDDMANVDALRSRVINAVGRSPRGIGARKTEVRPITGSDAFAFCRSNHIQGGSPSTLAYGAFAGGELLAVMTFGPPRYAGDCDLELLRLCSLAGRSVPGVAAKLFAAFRRDRPTDRVLSYADRSWTLRPDGSVYERLGFRFDGTTPPSYWYVVNGRRKSRVSYTKKRLEAMGGVGATEREMAASLGFYRVYGLGNLRFVHEGAGV